ncbi:MAG: UbiA prenyltransferase family protein [Microcoleaceae cyanobacterium]
MTLVNLNLDWPIFIRLLRPHQWTKNFFCFAGVIFGDRLLQTWAWGTACLTVLIFSLIASAIYIFNDIQDIERDRLHPKKRFRPIASGKVGIKTASLIGIFLAIIAFSGAARLGTATLICVLLYVINNVAYSFRLKHLPLFDVSCIALGFVLRLLAGIYALGDLPTAWIILCTFFLTLFLGFAKRRSELLSLLSIQMSQDFLESQSSDLGNATSPMSSELFYLNLFYRRGKINSQRPVLSHYTLPFLDSLLNSTATMTIMCYSLFTITSGKNPSLVMTVPIVYYAVMHYKRLVTVLASGEEPDQILLQNRILKISILIWLLSYLLILYFDLQIFR